MPCLLGCLALIAPRLVIILLVIFSDFIGRAFKGDILLPFLGFLFCPTTTLAYAWTINTNERISGIYWLLIIAAVLVDLGLLGGGSRSAAHWRKKR